VATLTFANYKSLVKGYLQENRTSTTNPIFTETDIGWALNAAQCELAQEVGLTCFRSSGSKDCATGDITPPTDFFGDATVTLVVSATDRRKLPVVTVKSLHERDPMWTTKTCDSGSYPTQFAWKITSSGIRGVLYPAPAATITNGLFFEYAAKPTDMSADADTCTLLVEFPHLQPTILPAGALKILTLLEGGEADEQFQKWEQIWRRDLDRLRQYINNVFVSPTRS
jgi:hypothetical protein